MNVFIYVVSGIYVLFCVLLVLIIKFKKLHEIVIRFSIKFTKIFLRKKDLDLVEKKLRTNIDSIVKNSSMLYDNKKQTIKIVFIYLIRAIVVYSLPYIIYLFLSKNNFVFSDYTVCLAYAMIITFCLWVIPIPGGAGASEMIFYLLYSLVITDEVTIRAAILVWRFFTYYINLILGLIVLLVIKNKDMITDVKKSQEKEEN